MRRCKASLQHGTVVERPDVYLHRALGDERCLLIVEHLLLAGPATQKEVANALDLDASTISRRMAELERLGIVRRNTRRGPYELSHPEPTRNLIEGAAGIMSSVLGEQARVAEERSRALRKAGMSSGRLRDREQRPS
jgi:DNA-binding HxlR family transcriptional regulator